MADPIDVRIEKLVYGGEGLAHHQGHTVFAPFVLPDESVSVEPVEMRKKFIRGRVAQIKTPASDRAVAPCPYFGVCGGCHYQHIPYPLQLRYKAEILREGGDIAILALGSMVYPCLEAAAQLEALGIHATVINARFMKPLDEELISVLAAEKQFLVTAEEGTEAGGFGAAVAALLHDRKIPASLLRIAVPDRIIPHGAPKVDPNRDCGDPAKRCAPWAIIEYTRQLQDSKSSDDVKRDADAGSRAGGRHYGRG